MARLVGAELFDAAGNGPGWFWLGTAATLAGGALRPGNLARAAGAWLAKNGVGGCAVVTLASAGAGWELVAGQDAGIGVSLLASSRASPLPQGGCGARHSLWERACSRRGQQKSHHSNDRNRASINRRSGACCVNSSARS